MELGRSTQRLPRAQAATAFFGMMHEQDCETMASLQFSQIGQERSDLAAGVLVDPVQPHERVQDQQPGRKIRDGLLETSAVAVSTCSPAGVSESSVSDGAAIISDVGSPASEPA